MVLFCSFLFLFFSVNFLHRLSSLVAHSVFHVSRSHFSVPPPPYLASFSFISIVHARSIYLTVRNICKRCRSADAPCLPLLQLFSFRWAPFFSFYYIFYGLYLSLSLFISPRIYIFHQQQLRRSVGEENKMQQQREKGEEDDEKMDGDVAQQR